MISVGRADKSSMKQALVLSEQLEKMRGECDRDHMKRCTAPVHSKEQLTERERRDEPRG